MEPVPIVAINEAKKIIKLNWSKKGINNNEESLKENIKNERLLEVKSLIEEIKPKKYKTIEDFWWDLYFPNKRQTQKRQRKALYNHHLSEMQKKNFKKFLNDIKLDIMLFLSHHLTIPLIYIIFL